MPRDRRPLSVRKLACREIGGLPRMARVASSSALEKFRNIQLQDGKIEAEVKLTGILSLGALLLGESRKYGTTIAPGLYALVHQHFFVARMDMAVDCKPTETFNQVVEVNVKVEEPGQHNIHNNAFYAEEKLLRSERKQCGIAILHLHVTGLYLAELFAERHKLAPFVQILPFCHRLLNQVTMPITRSQSAGADNAANFEEVETSATSGSSEVRGGARQQTEAAPDRGADERLEDYYVQQAAASRETQALTPSTSCGRCTESAVPRPVLHRGACGRTSGGVFGGNHLCRGPRLERAFPTLVEGAERDRLMERLNEFRRCSPRVLTARRSTTGSWRSG
uniref:Amine oxidase n=1 Tax=Ananas comosus var. bracteatus TaxID=296719 RepID=A0A6V7Q2K0_ANACO|nr:unnamed protein product [Ananas comosus var. bracteatus]